MTKKVVKRATAGGRQRTAREPGLSAEQVKIILQHGEVHDGKNSGQEAVGPAVGQKDVMPPSYAQMARLKAKSEVMVTVAFEWGLASAIREEVFHLPDVAEAVEFVRITVEEGFWLKGQGQDPEYTFIPWHRVLTVRALEGVAAAMSERKVAG